jgi:hypothetical protein
MEYEVIVTGDEKSGSDNLRGLIYIACHTIAEVLDKSLTKISETYGHSKEELAALLRDDLQLKEVLEYRLKFKEKKEEQQPIQQQKPEEKKTKKGKRVVIKKQEASPQPSDESSKSP